MTRIEADKTEPSHFPSPEETRKRIEGINRKLNTFAQQAAAEQQFDFVGEIGELSPEEQIVLPDGVTSPAFWNHYVLGSAVAHARLLAEEVQYTRGDTSDIAGELITYQKRTVGLLRYWGGEPTTDLLQQESVQASLDATRSFHWGKRSELLTTFSNEVVALGEQFALLSGVRLL